MDPTRPVFGQTPRPQPTPAIDKPKITKPEVKPTKPDGDKPGVSKGLLAGLGAVAVGGMVALGLLFNVASAPAPAPTVDNVDQATVERLAREFAAMSAQPIQLDPVPVQEVSKAIAPLKLDPQSQAALVKDVHSGATKLLYLGFRDFAYEDGDVVTVSVGGLVEEVALYHGTTMIGIPAPADGSPVKVTVGGTRDGNGGITVEGFARGQRLPLPVMAPGQTATFQVK